MTEIMDNIKAFVEENKNDWSTGAVAQIEKVMQLIHSETKSFECSGTYAGIYDGEHVSYEGNEGKKFRLDVAAFQEDVYGNLEAWWVPTLEGPNVDLWLLK